MKQAAAIEPDVTIAGNQTTQSRQDYDAILEDIRDILDPMVLSVYRSGKTNPDCKKALKQVLKEIEQQY